MFALWFVAPYRTHVCKILVIPILFLFSRTGNLFTLLKLRTVKKHTIVSLLYDLIVASDFVNGTLKLEIKWQLFY